MTREPRPATRRVRISVVRVVEVEGSGPDLLWRVVPDGPYDPTPVGEWERAGAFFAGWLATCEGPDFLPEPEVLKLEGHGVHLLKLPRRRCHDGLLDPWIVWSPTPIPTDEAHVSERYLGSGATRAAALADATTRLRDWKRLLRA